MQKLAQETMEYCSQIDLTNSILQTRYFPGVPQLKHSLYDSTISNSEKETKDRDPIRETHSEGSQKEEKHDNDRVESSTVIKLANGDCLDEAQKLVSKGHSVCVLNMAPDKRPGRGFLQGACAQEESLCMRSSLFYSLTDPQHQDKSRDCCQDWYPLSRLSSIYCPDVVVFRDSENTIMERKDHFKVDVITIAAIKKPYLVNRDGKERRLNFQDEVIMNKKIKTMLTLGILHNKDAIVLSSFGCGVFGNPPEHVAQLFVDVLNKTTLKNKYKEIVFAIIDYNKSNNYLIFKQVFEKNRCQRKMQRKIPRGRVENKFA